MIYAKPGESAQQFGGTCPDGWVPMQSARPEGDYVASETGEWVTRELTYAEALRALNSAYDSDRATLALALADARLMDGEPEAVRVEALQADYVDLWAQYDSDLSELKSQYGVI